MADKLKVLIVDDAAFMRKAVAQILDSDPELIIAGESKNGLEAVKVARKLTPDVITMDIDMPVMDGITAIKHLMIEHPVPIVVLSSLTSEGTVTFEALRLGVVDFVPKPSGSISTDMDSAKKQLIDRIKVARSVNMDNVRRVRLSRKWGVKDRINSLYGYIPLDHIIAIGTTLSGPNTVIRLLSQLSPSLPACVVVIQEISPRIIDSFCREFNEHVPWRVEVAREGMPLEQGTCYISSTEDPHSIDADDKGLPCLKKSVNPRRPLDALFETASRIFSRNTLGLLLTGIGEDGAEGFAAIKDAHGVTVAQKAECCVYPNLTQNAIVKGVVDRELDENDLARFIETIIV